MAEERESRISKGPSRVGTFLSQFVRSWQVLAGLIIVSLFFVTAIVVEVAGLFGVTVTPYNPLRQNVGGLLAPPSLSHPFGTDQLGRDVFSRIVSATPNDVAVGVSVVVFSFFVGILIGSIAAFRGGLLDELLMRFTDVVFALPALVIAMVIAVALGPGVGHMMIAMMVVWWPPYARLARGEALKVSHQNYIKAARLSGMGTWKIVIKHMFSNIFTTMLVYATLDVGSVILIYAGLSYLGLSVVPPYPDWGQMVSSTQDYLVTAPWLPIIPGLVIALGVVGFSLLGDGVAEYLEAR